MQKALTDFQHCRLITFIWFILPVLLPPIAAAQTTDTQRTVVLVSMMEQRSALYWSRGEQRITSELKMSDVNVISYAGTPFAAMNMEDELKRAAESQRADFAFFLYKTGLQNVRLMIYATPSTDDAQEYTTYDFQLDTTEESENIVALKAAEAVLAVMKIETRESAPPSNPDQTPAPSSVKLAIALAIAGAISVGVGIGFHYQKMIHEQDATDYSNQMNATYADRYPPEYDALRSQYSESMDATKTARARAVAGYVIGGALLSVSAAILSYRRFKHQKKAAPAAMFFHGTGVTWEF